MALSAKTRKLRAAKRPRGRPPKRGKKRPSVLPACRIKGTFTPEGVGYARGLLDAGSESTRDMAARLGCSQSTVMALKKRVLGAATAKTISPPVSPQKDQKEKRIEAVEKILNAKPLANAMEVCVILADKYHIYVSRQTAWRDVTVDLDPVGTSPGVPRHRQPPRPKGCPSELYSGSGPLGSSR